MPDIPDNWPPTGADVPRPDQCWRLDEDTFLVWYDGIGQYIEVGPVMPNTYFELPPGAVELVPAPADRSYDGRVSRFWADLPSEAEIRAEGDE